MPYQRLGVGHWSSGGVDQERAVSHGRQKVIIDKVPCPRCQRDSNYDNVLQGQQLRQLRHPMDGAALIRPFVPCNAGYMRFEGQQPLFNGLSYAAVADNKNPTV